MAETPRRLLRPFEDICAWHGTIGRTQEAFEDEGVPPAKPFSHDTRRGTFESYLLSIDRGRAPDQRRLLRVLETILSWAPEDDEAREKAVMALGRDGLAVDSHGRITYLDSRRSWVDSLPLDELRDPASILDHINRLSSASDTDPNQAISSAKSLIEATVKLVLEELGRDYDERADLPELVRQVQRALNLHPDSVAPTAKGRETIRRILSNLSQVAIGVAELRNEYGTDHGRTTHYRLTPRHAHLAVGCADTFCRLLLETLSERRHEV